MSSLPLDGGPTPGSRSHVIPQNRWEEVKAKVKRLYMDQGMTLEQVMVEMKQDGFIATTKQYKTQFEYWGMRKYRRSNRQQLSGGRIPNRDDGVSGAISDMDSVTSELQQQVLNAPPYPPNDASESNSSYQLGYGQQVRGYPQWQPSPEVWLPDNQLGVPSSLVQSAGSGGRSYVDQLPQDTAITVRGVLSRCDKGFAHLIVHEEDIIEFERLAEFLSLVGSQQDAFKVAQALFSHIAAMLPYPGHLSTHLAQVAIMMIMSARLLHNCDQIMTWLNVPVYPSMAIGSRDDKHWPLLSSLFGVLVQGSSGASTQHSLELCCNAAKKLSGMSSSDTFDWRYIVLIVNCRQVCAARNIHYDINSAWRDYYPRKHTVAFKNIDGYLESLLMWCTATLDDADSWGDFDALSADIWTRTSNLADVSELEYKALFCYFYKCLQSDSHIAPRSECHTLLQDALTGLEKDLHVSTCEAMSAVSKMLMRPQTQLHPGQERSNLVHRALSRMKEVRQLKSPLNILSALGWEGSLLSANFLDTLVQQYSHPYRLSNLQYERVVDKQIRDFLDRNLALKFSMNAFMENHYPQRPPFSGPEGSTTMSLLDLIKA